MTASACEALVGATQTCSLSEQFPGFRARSVVGFFRRRPMGVDGEILFQSDVGARRLNLVIVNRIGQDRIDLAAEAVASIYRFQNAARQTDLDRIMPHLGTNHDWIENFVAAVDALQPFSEPVEAAFDRDAVKQFVDRPGTQFVKWDCRSGNAAIAGDDRLRWFDLEYSGMRHGAEDFTWLIGDEAWPVAPETMLDIMNDAFDPDTGLDRGPYMEYLSVYVTLHCVQRFKLIVKEAQKRGWLSKEKVRKYDDAGVHPDFAAQLCNVGRFYADQSALTAPLAGNFDAAMQVFLTSGADAKLSVGDLVAST